MPSKVSELLKRYQSGEYQATQDELPNIGRQNQQPPIVNGPFGNYGNQALADETPSSVNNSFTEEAVQAGYGTSRYDQLGGWEPGRDIEQTRAMDQSAFSKVMAGLTKGLVTAGTTFINTTAGTVFGVGTSLFSLSDQMLHGKFDVQDAIDDGVTNAVSGWMQGIQDWSERALPNYRTEQERSEQYQKEWWKPSHFFSANNIGDNLLKNFGFTVGAMGGGLVWANKIGKRMTRKAAGDMMKGVAVSAAGDAEAASIMQGVAQSAQSGAVTVQAQTLMNRLKDAARKVTQMDAQQQLYTATISAMGEGTMEGNMAKKEYLDKMLPDLERFYLEADRQVEDDVASEHPEWTRIGLRFDEQGRPVRKPIVISEEGKSEIRARRQELLTKYNQAVQYAQEQGDRLASTTFILNLPVLVGSNLIEFSRLFGGGFKSARGAAKGVTGAVGAMRGMSRAESILRGTGKALKLGGAEAFEEMAQGAISSGAQRVADDRLTAFNDDAFDKDSVESMRNWYESMVEGSGEYLGDTKNWQEGAIGALTGLFGIPGRGYFSGQRGGLAQAVNEARAERLASQEAATALNNLVNSKEFRDNWNGYIRHLKYGREMKEAIGKDDPYAWHTADDKQIISDVMTFAKVGRLEDLRDRVISYGQIDESQAEQIKQVLATDNNQSELANLSNAEVVERVKKQADRMLQTIDEYKEMHDALTARAPIDTPDELIDELVFTAQNIKAYERRFLTMLGEVMQQIEPILEIRAAFKEDGTTYEEDAAKQRSSLAELQRSYADAFAGSILPRPMSNPYFAALEKNLNALETAAKDDEELTGKIKDMRKLSKDRERFYRKLITLEGTTAEEYNQKKQTQEKIQQQAEVQQMRQEAEAYTSVDNVKDAYLGRAASERDGFAEQLDRIRTENPNVDEFLKIRDAVLDFKEFVDTNANQPNPYIRNWVNKVLREDLLRRARSVQDIYDMDSVLPSYDDFILTMQQNATNKATDFMIAHSYPMAKQYLKDRMTEYQAMAGKVQSSSTPDVDPQVLAEAQKKSEEVTVRPTGRDASQPASTVGVPDGYNPQDLHPRARVEAEPATEVEITMAPKATGEDLAEDATAVVDTTPEEEQAFTAVEPKTQMYGFLRTGMPQIDSKRARQAREALRIKDPAQRREALAKISLADFPVDHNSYYEIWHKLDAEGAFQSVVTDVHPGDKIYFIIDPSKDIKYKDENEILLAVETPDGLQIVSTLSHQTESKAIPAKNRDEEPYLVRGYYGLAELRKAIMDEYNVFKDAHPGERFVFSKQSTVWAKQYGLIDYDYTGQNEASITARPGYDKNAPIVFYDENGDPHVLKGDPNALLNMHDFLFDIDTQQKRKSEALRGHFYYLTPDGKEGYIPIRLNIEHLTPENQFHNKFQGIHNAVGDIIRKASEQMQVLLSVPAGTEREALLDDANKALHNTVKTLNDRLDIRDLIFSLKLTKNGTPLLSINHIERDQTGAISSSTEIYTKNLSQLDGMDLVKFLAVDRRSVKVHVKRSGEGANEKTTVEGLNDILDAGFLTTNARSLYPKGADFYMYTWVDGDFKPMGAQREIRQDEQAQLMSNRAAGHLEDMPVQPEPEPMPSDETPSPQAEPEPTEKEVDPEEQAMQDFMSAFGMSGLTSVPSMRVDVEAGKTEEPSPLPSRPEVDEPLPGVEKITMPDLDYPYSQLPKSIRDALSAKGITEEMYDGNPIEDDPAVTRQNRRKYLACIGVE